MKRELSIDIERLKQPHIFILEDIKDLNTQQLNKIPVGFNNNIVWHLGHLVWAQQHDCYVRNGLKIFVDDKYFTPYSTGTKPASIIGEEDIAAIKGLLISTFDHLATDVDKGVILINDSIRSVALHAWLHAGYVMALKRLVK